MLNIGLMWLRSSDATRAVVERTANRTRAGWDQAIFNEELQFTQLTRNRTTPTCCTHINHVWDRLFGRDWALHYSSKGEAALLQRIQREGELRCAPGVHSTLTIPQAVEPPFMSRYRWKEGWHADAYNELPVSRRRLGRCTWDSASCQRSQPPRASPVLDNSPAISTRTATHHITIRKSPRRS